MELEFVFPEWIWLPDTIRWNQLRRGESSYMHAVPWLALIILLLRSFVQ